MRMQLLYIILFFKLKNGKQLLGYIASETPTEVDIKIIGGTLEKIPANDIISRKAYNHSLMPTGFATSMSQDQLVSLVEISEYTEEKAIKNKILRRMARI